MTRDTKVLGPSIAMIVISLLLFWLPGFGPLIAGYVGGRMAGDAKSALSAAFLPMIASGILVFVFISFIGLPVVGMVVGVGAILYIAMHEIALIAGALIGGILASS